ncbi:MAG: hypothetical protein ACRDG4_07200, partial [Chloroflexota bacterium]
MTDAPTIMLVTADEDRRVTLSRLLRRAGFLVQLACSDREAIHSLASPTLGARALPALLIVDQASLGSGAERVIGSVHRAELN